MRRQIKIKITKNVKVQENNNLKRILLEKNQKKKKNKQNSINHIFF